MDVVVYGVVRYQAPMIPRHLSTVKKRGVVQEAIRCVVLRVRQIALVTGSWSSDKRRARENWTV